MSTRRSGAKSTAAKSGSPALPTEPAPVATEPAAAATKSTKPSRATTKTEKAKNADTSDLSDSTAETDDLSTSEKKPKEQTKWTSADDAKLVNFLLTQKQAGLQSENGWKKIVFTDAARHLAGSEHASGGIAKGASSIRGRWQKIKSNFVIVHKLRSNSGFGWDDGTKTATANNQVWADYLEKNAKAGFWRDKGFPLYDEMVTLVKGIVATGDKAFRPGRGTDSESDSETFNLDVSSEGDDDDDDDDVPDTPEKKKSGKGREDKSDDTPRPKKSGRASKATQATALHAIASAMEKVVAADAAPPPNAQASSHVQAIAALGEDLSDEDYIKAVQLFQDKPGTADSYLAIRPAARPLFLQKEFEMFFPST